ncbi:MAG: hypothetical protein ABS45_00810 [Comamonas sp. SCN 65-56]|nr:MAG: hypothetical protein ABS45_00810 [Comamonas sp. SCN 65-56]
MDFLAHDQQCWKGAKKRDQAQRHAPARVRARLQAKHDAHVLASISAMGDILGRMRARLDALRLGKFKSVELVSGGA